MRNNNNKIILNYKEHTLPLMMKDIVLSYQEEY